MPEESSRDVSTTVKRGVGRPRVLYQQQMVVVAGAKVLVADVVLLVVSPKSSRIQPARLSCRRLHW